MKYIPHDYQAYATEFILAHPAAAILLQMGLEKMRYCLTQIYRFRDAGYEELEKMPDAAVTDRVK